MKILIGNILNSKAQTIINNMKKTLLIFAFIFCIVAPAFGDDWNQLETIDESRQRHAAENYRIYENRGYQAPLGGYGERLGDTAPRGTETPGIHSTQPQVGFQSTSDKKGQKYRYW